MRGVAINAVDHSSGSGGRQYSDQSKSISRNAPPGRKVDDIAPKHTGRGGKGGK